MSTLPPEEPDPLPPKPGRAPERKRKAPPAVPPVEIPPGPVVEPPPSPGTPPPVTA